MDIDNPRIRHLAARNLTTPSLTTPRVPTPRQARKHAAGTPTSTRAFFSVKAKPPAPAAPAAPAPPAASTPAPPPFFAAVPSSYFSYEQQTVKGPRANTDVGTPTDASRPFVKGIQGGQASCGSWGCTEGGWLSPKPRTSTEWFYVLAGRGSVQTPDGREFSFGPGDLVVLPRGWAGRWDVQERIHKIWVVHEHEDIPGADKEPVVVTRKELFRARGGVASVVGSASSRGVSAYDVGATRAGSWMCSPGSFDVSPRPVAEVFVVVKGAMFLTNNDGSARRCGVGDVVHLPEMWSGRVDVVEEVATVFAEVAETGSRVAGEVDAKYAGSDTRGAPGGAEGATNGNAAAIGNAKSSAGATLRAAGAGKPIYEVGAPVPVPSWGWGASSPASAESDKAKYEVCLAVLENSDDPELVAAAKARLLKYLE